MVFKDYSTTGWPHILGRLSSFAFALLLATLVAPAAITGAAHVQTQCTITVHHIEVSQAQQYDPRVTEERVPLINARATGVRVYVTSNCPMLPIEGEIKVRIPAGQHGSMIEYGPWRSENTVIAVTSPENIKRWQDVSTLNYSFIALAYPDGTPLEVEAVACVAGATCSWSEGPMKSETYAVEDGKWPLIVARPVNYTYEDAPAEQKGLPRLDRIRRGSADSIANGVWPWAWNIRYTLNYEPIEFPWNADYNRGWRNSVHRARLFQPMESTRRATRVPGFKCRPDAMYLWFKENALCGNRCDEEGKIRGAAPPQGEVRLDIAIGDDALDAFRKTLAHELGHIIGELPEDGTTGLDQVGWDSWRWLRLDGVQTMARPGPGSGEVFYNVMNQGPPSRRTWVETESYLDMRDELNSLRKASFGIGECSSQVTLIMELKHTDSPPGWSIGPTMELDTHNGPMQLGTEGRATIKLIDGHGVALYTTVFDPGEYTGQGEESWLFEVPALSNTEVIELYWDHELVASRERTANAPDVTITSPEPGETLDENTLVSWSASDTDGDPLLATALFSHDDGESYLPMTVMTTTTTVPFVTAGKPSGQQAAIIVNVTDGMNTSKAVVTDLQFGSNNLPDVALSTPIEGSVYRVGANVPLTGSAYDAEDGFLTGSSLVWYSDRDGLLGTGLGLNVLLSRGTHLISLQATDSAQETGAGAVTIEVQ